jgi:threonine aldolase
MVKPRLVYTSLSTESGTVYSKAELSAISGYCRSNGLYLYLDGARLGSAVNSPACDLSYSDVANLVDAFFLGGTKNGALYGEAIIICNETLKTDFRFLLKQRGAMLAKGAAIGVQFEELLKDGLYDELARHSNSMAKRLADGVGQLGYSFLYPPDTNLIIPVFPTEIAERMRKLYDFHYWHKMGEKLAVRLVTSWATPENAVDDFITDLSGMR